MSCVVCVNFIMHSDVISCVIYMSSKVEYLEKLYQRSYTVILRSMECNQNMVAQNDENVVPFASEISCALSCIYCTTQC